MIELKKLQSEISLVKQTVLSIERNTLNFGGWIPKKVVMRYFDYASTQLRALELSKSIEVSKIGNRKFYSLASIIELIEKNKQ